MLAENSDSFTFSFCMCIQPNHWYRLIPCPFQVYSNTKYKISLKKKKKGQQESEIGLTENNKIL